MASTVRSRAANAPKTATSRSAVRPRPARPRATNVPQTARDVADYLIALAEEEEEYPPTPERLAYLVYIAHGWNLAINGQPLIKNQIEARRRGPAIKGLYEKAGSKKDRFLRDHRKLLDHYKKQKGMSIVKVVFEHYRHWSRSDLGEMTHNSGTPWDIVWNQWSGRRWWDSTPIPISNELIKEFFVSLGKRIKKGV